MLIDDLVEYCDEQYQSGECGACTGKDRCVNECDGNCKLCLDDIHFHEQQRRTQYNCERLLYYYVCRYSYKYCSSQYSTKSSINIFIPTQLSYYFINQCNICRQPLYCIKRILG